MKTFKTVMCGAFITAASLALPVAAAAQTGSSMSSSSSMASSSSTMSTDQIGVWVSPFIGVNTGNDMTDKSGSMGISAGYMVYKGWIGIEGEVATAPNFFLDNNFRTQRRMTTAMGNIVVGVPYLKNDMFAVQVSGGLGMIRPNIAEAGGFSKAEVKKLGYDVGANVAGFMNKNVGLRADVRYFRTLKADTVANAFGYDFSGFGFWRTSLGLVVRF